MKNNRTTLRSGRFGVMASMVCVAGALISGCFKEPLAPVMPTWDVNLTVPMVNRTYTIAQIVEKDTSLLRVGVGNTLSLVTSSEIQPTYIGNAISFDPQDASTTMKLGIFNVAMAPIVSPIVIPGLPQGMTVPIPDTIFTAPVVYDTISTFESVSLVEGTMTLTFRNNLPVPVDIVAPVYVVDDANIVIATFEYNPTTIPPNASRSVSENMASKTIGSPLTLGNVISIAGLVVHIHGSSTPVQIPFGDMMIASMTSSGLKARRAVNIYLASQRLVDSDSSHLPISDSTLVQEIVIRSGALNLDMRSSIDLDIIFKYKFKELFRLVAGTFVPYEDSVFIPRHGFVNRSIALGGYRIRSTTGNLLASLEAVSTVIVPISSTQPITLNDTDNVHIALTHTGSIVADSAVGVVQPTWVNINTVVPLNLKDLPSRLNVQLNIPTVSLILATQSGIGFPLDLDMRLGSEGQSGDSVFLNVPASQRRVQPGVGSIQFDGASVGQFLGQISGGLPDSIRISGRALVNPYDVYNPSLAGVGRVGSNSGLAGRMDLRIPFSFGISNGLYSDTVAWGDTSGNGGGSSSSKSVLKDMNSGSVYIEIQNGTPLQVDVVLHLFDHERREVLTLPKSGQSIRMGAASVDAQGNVTTATRSTVVLDLSRADIQQVIPAEFVGYSLSFVSIPGAASVNIKTSDNVKLRVWSSLSYRVQ